MDPSTPGPNQEPLSIPNEASAEMRRLLHDMNNGLEIIIQASYLIGTLNVGEDGKQWIKLLDQGVQNVAALNGKLRDLIRTHSS